MGSANRGRYAWIPLAVVNALPIVFGTSFIWWPSSDVRAHDGTDGMFHVNRYLWGAYAIVSAIAMLVALYLAFARRNRWAWNVLWYDLVFFVAVALIEPDYFFPVIFALVAAAALYRSRPRFRTSV